MEKNAPTRRNNELRGQIAVNRWDNEWLFSRWESWNGKWKN